MTYILIGLISMAASTVQTATGFGFAMIGMALWSLLIPFRAAATVEVITVLFVNLYVTWRLRKSVRWRLILWPLAGSLLLSPLGVYTLMISSEVLLRRLLGAALIILSVYFICFGGNLRLKATRRMGFGAGAVSGFFAGLMGIGGPPIAMYYISVTDEKQSYNATVQCFFLIAGIYTLMVHLIAGNVTGEVLRYSAVSLVGLGIGTAVGFAIFKKLTITGLKKTMYIFMAVIGVYLLIRG